jgi:hypothetical protein
MPKTEHMIILPDYQAYTPALRDKIRKAIEKRQTAFDFEINGRAQRFNMWHLMADFSIPPVEIPAPPMPETAPATGGKK